MGSDVSPTTLPTRNAPREQAGPAHRTSTRLGAMLPLGIIVVLAVICIVIAAVTSAQRANDVAFGHETNMFRNALVHRGEWSLRQLKTMLVPDAGEDSAASASLERLIFRVHSASKTLFDHDFILIADGSGRLVYTLMTADSGYADLPPSVFAEIAPMLAYMQGRDPTPPDRVTWLSAPKSAAPGLIGELAFMQTFSNGKPIIVSIALDANEGTADAGKPAAVLALQLMDQTKLTELGNRLLLANLRQIGDRAVSPGDRFYELRDDRGRPVARFAWTPHRPAAQVLHSVGPFIAIAIVGFALLTALVLRRMRRSASDIAEAERRMRYLALHDPLCGLPNRIYFAEELSATISKVRSGAPPAALFYVDLDHFKDVNDTLGHSIGDELIRNVTQRLTNTLRGNDLVARLGGDEFAVITSAGPDPASLQSIARRIIAALCAPYLIEGNPIVIGASIGIAFITSDSDDSANDLMRYADMALYRAKNEGRNRACIYDTAMDADLSRRKQLEQDLRQAIESDRLDVAYQPIVNASGEKIVAAEALVRWSHRDRGFISPLEFIPLAEHSGLIIQLGEWVLRRACRDASAWPGLSVAVNVSPLQFRQADFVEMVERVLTETGFDAARLELELTESTLIGNVEFAEAAMRRLKSLGVLIVLDDFGTGYSSLLYLRRFPFDKIKIDRSFVHSIELTDDAAAIVHAIISLGRGLKMKVTAEGVENVEQHLFLRAAGVHFMQGYRFGRPCAASEIAKVLAMPGAYRSIELDAVAAIAS